MKIQTYEVPERIGGGKDGVVFKISDGLVTKIGLRGDKPIKREARIAEELYERKISIPKPVGIFDISFPYMNEENFFGKYKGFVMEYIEGLTGYGIKDKLEPSEIKKINNLLENEIQKAKNLGFYPLDARSLGNFIYTPNKEIKLIDFNFWDHEDFDI